jgi:peptidoglycan/LPS O-acetylase OafA/YrhL
LILAIVGGALSAINGDYTNTVKIGHIIAAIASLIFGILILGFGIKMRGGSNDRVAFLSGLLRVIGLATILGATFSAIGSYLINDGLGASIAGFIWSLVIGIIFLWAAAKVSGKSKNVISKVVWIVLIILFILALIGAIIGCIGSISTELAILVTCIANLCWALVYLFGLAACFSPEVKSSMGI